MTLDQFNELERQVAVNELFACCGSEKWASLMMERFPFFSEESLIDAATNAWYQQCSEADWKESFGHHPKIGDKQSLKQKFAGKEQAGVALASDETVEALARANSDYENKFGFIFIVCATGRTADEMLQLCTDRIKNNTSEELRIAMGEQQKITIIRLRKLLSEANFNFLKMSQITTHILDTSAGKPAKDVSIRLQQKTGESWQTIAQGVTNADGRIADLLPSGKILATGVYKMVFDTGAYFANNNVEGFYPEVDIQFMIADDSHYHVPLLINPFGYSTYRGS
jgi:5-hydroxyisourate hydrolase/2-oxo-4-hydroxy-4-carboxy-5-ureidoimidazoline decarboxylase